MIDSSRIGRPNRHAPWWPANYRAGTWAWVLHRLTGLALVGYLFLHIWVISFSTVKWGGVSFDMIMGQFQTPMFYVLDLGLLAVVLFHGLNGLRILLFDVGIGVRIQKQILWAVVFVVIIAELAAAYHAVPRIFG